MCGRFTIPDEAAVSRFLKIDRWNWNWPEPRDMASATDSQAYQILLFERFPSAQTTEDMRALMPQHVDRSLLPIFSKPKPRKK